MANPDALVTADMPNHSKEHALWIAEIDEETVSGASRSVLQEAGAVMGRRGALPSIGFLSTYAPTSCGLATFTAALRQAMADGRGSPNGLSVVRVADNAGTDGGPEVVYEHRNADPDSLLTAIEVLNRCEVVLIQHEFGIYGGPDGREVLDLLANLEIPAIVTLHTVLSQPSVSQRLIMEKVAALAARTVVMSQTAYWRLVGGYDVDPATVRVIPHGARASLVRPPAAPGTRPLLLTWGLLGPGKGLELAIEAVASLRDLNPLPRYVILGRTHPKVRASQGDAYRDGLIRRIHQLGLEGVVEFDDRYLDPDTLARAISAADVVVLPYESTEQVTSGVLVEAVAAGKPVVATAFPHAVELLESGAGVVVPHGDSAAMTAALRQVLTDSARAIRMADEARRISTALHWPSIARRYHTMATKLVAQGARAPRAEQDLGSVAATG